MLNLRSNAISSMENTIQTSYAICCWKLILVQTPSAHIQVPKEILDSRSLSM